MISREQFFGGAYEVALTGDADVILGNGRVQVFTPDANGYTIYLPQATFGGPKHPLHAGGPVFYLCNNGVVGHDITVKEKSTGLTIGTLAADNICTVFLVKTDGWVDSVQSEIITWEMDCANDLVNISGTTTPSATTTPGTTPSWSHTQPATTWWTTNTTSTTISAMTDGGEFTVYGGNLFEWPMIEEGM